MINKMSDGSTPTCAICLSAVDSDESRPNISLGCSHRYHQECTRQFNKRACPQCAAPLLPDELDRLEGNLRPVEELAGTAAAPAHVVVTVSPTTPAQQQGVYIPIVQIANTQTSWSTLCLVRFIGLVITMIVFVIIAGGVVVYMFGFRDSGS